MLFNSPTGITTPNPFGLLDPKVATRPFSELFIQSAIGVTRSHGVDASEAVAVDRRPAAVRLSTPTELRRMSLVLLHYDDQSGRSLPDDGSQCLVRNRSRCQHSG